MSGIQLSSEMISDIKSVLMKHDPQVQNDMFFMQYLAAMAGYVLAHQTAPNLDKREFLNELHVFAGHVLDQMEQDAGQESQQEEAFGVWKP